MTEPLLKELALEIVQRGLLENWKFYAVLLALLFLSTAAGVFLTKYLGRRAEVYATKSDLHEVLRQLKATTELTEQVKVAVSHADWLAREWKALRRTKLEELVEASLSLTRWLGHQRLVSFFQAEQKNPEPPADRVGMLASLYFPELETESAALVLAQNTAYAWIANIANNSIHMPTLSKREALLVRAATEWLPLHGAVINAVALVKQKASTVMLTMWGA